MEGRRVLFNNEKKLLDWIARGQANVSVLSKFSFMVLLNSRHDPEWRLEEIFVDETNERKLNSKIPPKYSQAMCQSLIL